MPITWSDEKLIILYCPGRGSNSRPSTHRSFTHGQGVPRPYPLGHGGSLTIAIVHYTSIIRCTCMLVKTLIANEYYCHLDTFSKLCIICANRIVHLQNHIAMLFKIRLIFSNQILSRASSPDLATSVFNTRAINKNR